LLVAGQALAPHAKAMVDVSDGLLLDARRMAETSGCAAAINLDALPLSGAFVEARGKGRAARLFAATGGDDYALLAACPPDFDPALRLSSLSGASLACIGTLADAGPLLSLVGGGRPVPLPEHLGHEHRGISGPAMGNRP
jgi:thiamine-monophosphate kinase